MQRSAGVRSAWLIVCVGAVLLAVVGSVLVGSSSISPGEAWQALLDGGVPLTDAAVAVREVRLPRTVTAVLVGAAMGAAGALMQGVTRNPLADPGILGVNAGAAFMVVVAIGVFGLATPSRFLWFAFAGALGATVLVYALGNRGPARGSPVMMTLAGAAVTILLTSASSILLLTDRAGQLVFARWSVGSLEGARLTVIGQLAPFLLLGIALAIVSGRLLNALSLGEEVARGLGQRVGPARVIVLAAVTLCCGAGTAAAGPVSFVGLAVPHLARRMVGPDYRWVTGLSVLLGAVFLLLADIAGRVIVAPSVLPAGALTAIIGGPVFIALAQSRRLREL
ncbi:iron ABC transporter permease [Aeromicrobium sp. YIM 150415]|nr:iron ABC transporter permease [Aeromicrobium sp. YIM 150415]